ncbi:MAG: aspartate--tRNA ligase [Acidimicrobiales bacterium]
MRSHYCGEVTDADLGSAVSLCGWVGARREHGEHLAFVDLRDHTGVIQCVVDGASDLRSEYVVQVTGTVRSRPEGTVNPGLRTGALEVGNCQVQVLSVALPPPFPLSERVDADESLRLRHRYLDLRRPAMQTHLRLRARVASAIRRALESQGCVEVETPMLMASTPEGARDFVVPSRLAPGRFYALPQSPQLFKQLLMVGGVDRYYQMARCMRDEDLRADRQFEFTQVDVEASFVNQSDVMAMIDAAIAAAVKAAGAMDRVAPITTLTWDQAQDRFGSDKPDLRFGMELVDLTALFARTELRALRAESVKGILLGGGATLGRAALDRLTDRARSAGAGGLVWARVGEGRSLDSPVAKFLGEAETAGLISALGAGPGDLILVVAGARAVVNRSLGLLRLDLGRPALAGDGPLHFVWITDFPLFEAMGAPGADGLVRPQPAHHPFTMPHPDDLDHLESDPLSVRSMAYDLVLNGWELGSGSVRIHRAEIQSRVFDLVGLGRSEAASRFGFLLEAFTYGAPPHAGFAFGLDRLVALLAGQENIREVMAFPKTQSGADPLTGAPGPLDPTQLAHLGLRLAPPR